MSAWGERWPQASQDSSGGFFAIVTPDNSNDLPGGICRYLYIGGSGNIAIHDSKGNAVTFTGVQSGTFLPLRTNRVMSTNTTATLIIAIY